MKFWAKVMAILDRIIGFLGLLAGVLIIAMMLVMCYEVVMRYLLHRPPAWAVEMCEYMLFLIAFLGAPWLLKLEGHVKIDIILNMLNPKSQTLLNIATSALGVITCMLLAWYGGETAWDHFRRGIPVIKIVAIPKFIFLTVILIGCFLLSIQFLRQFYAHLRNRLSLERKE